MLTFLLIHQSPPWAFTLQGTQVMLKVWLRICECTIHFSSAVQWKSAVALVEYSPACGIFGSEYYTAYWTTTVMRTLLHVYLEIPECL